jgi:hypothetical protein
MASAFKAPAISLHRHPFGGVSLIGYFFQSSSASRHRWRILTEQGGGAAALWRKRSVSIISTVAEMS